MRTAEARKRLRLWLLLAVVTLIGSACGNRGPQDFLHPVGSVAKTDNNLWNITFLIAAVIFVIVEGLLVFAIIKFRARPDREPAQFHGNTRVEVVLTVIPALILAGLAVPTVKTIFDLARKPTGDVLEVKVIGHQFWWEYQYTDDDVVTANELHVPTGKPIHVTIEGIDVIHSFWIPKLVGKQDVVPGRVNFLTFTADEEGEYYGQCTEYCGLSHANMRLRVIAQSPSEFDQWLAAEQQPAESPSDPEAAEGEKIFLNGPCVNCHTVNGTDAQATTAPNLTHFASRGTFAGALFDRTDANLQKWLADPPGVKPGALMPDYGLSSDEITKLIAYLQSLK